MKNNILLFLIISLVYSCSTSNDIFSPTNSIPSAPTNLTGTIISSNQINLSWTDNSNNEIGFRIERKIGSGDYTIIWTTDTNIENYINTELLTNTTYNYRVYSYNSIGNSSSYSNEITLTTNIINLPTITTSPITSISDNSGVSGGNITNEGGSSIIEKGVCWSTSTNPTISLVTKTNEGTGIGTFTSNINGINPNTTYYLKAYATNSYGTSYGSELNFTSANTSNSAVTDIDGNIYQLTTICNQTWTKSNLNVSHYRNGDIIPQVQDPTLWANLTTGAWCYYDNDQTNEATYGKLYNWYAVNDSRGLAPLGFRIPNYNEISNLNICLGGENIAGGKLKSLDLWDSINFNATNEFDFNAIPEGLRNWDGTFLYKGTKCFLWNSTFQYINSASGSVMTNNTSSNLLGVNNVRNGFSIRCIKE